MSVLKWVSSYNNERDAWFVLYPPSKASSCFTLIVDVALFSE
ncbi:hypothetical protein [Staphylococcus aureus subsp. aureus N315]|uniref:Uncharacterized protein n=3 Tax=Staphylococcus aureus TaxID=1280 RepID=A0A125SVL8_STAAU|nr:hypothetical protein SA2981_0077 [Staphylococcus aureus 04-02981]EEV68554.1 conserved hypothetical protein [Staphylococcus aureus A9719]EFB94996.1 conserved hypothetical protein [Staphylococcus aureus A10102]EFT85049.1 hypothetical protein CGSSa03_13572 [Staphylococcus aureus subsp. aureus CGS03]CAG39102.1 hypothetical protein SAR0075a [Staphylococcus aureus subsp. aureus MRSA252]BAB41292.1 hypothetical protein [Staphylococcus aureus subsp. aureus N315]BAB56239.1 hypothetical protein SAV00